tara:strand:+ start:88 stop:894 length:807 start_codon:yes stop_codon:yes gene_type:complete
VKDGCLPTIRFALDITGAKINDVFAALAQVLKPTLIDKILIIGSATTHEQWLVGEQAFILLALQKAAPFTHTHSGDVGFLDRQTQSEDRVCILYTITKTLEANTADRRRVRHGGFLRNLLLIFATRVLNRPFTRHLHTASKQRASLALVTVLNPIEAFIDAPTQRTVGTAGAVLVETAVMHTIETLGIRATDRLHLLTRIRGDTSVGSGGLSPINRGRTGVCDRSLTSIRLDRVGNLLRAGNQREKTERNAKSSHGHPHQGATPNKLA